MATAISTSQINLAWTDNSGGTASFEIQRQTTVAGTYSTIATVAVGVVAYSDTGLASATGYTYRVRAISIGGVSAYSNEASATTQTAAPAAPTNLTATTFTTTSIGVSWTASVGATTYTLERSLHNAGVWTTVVTQAGTSTTDVGLTPATSYDYRVKATNAGGDSPLSSIASATTFQQPPPPQPPNAPSNLAASAVSTTQINLTWVDNSTNETSFELQRLPSTAVPPDFVTIATLAQNVTSYSDTGLTSSTTYTYRIRATNAAGASAYSNQAVATTQTAAPAAPANLTAIPQSTTSIALSWLSSVTATSYTLERSPHSAGTFVVIATQAGLTFTDTALTPNTSYDYRVKATNAGGSSPYSSIASATTFQQPPPPTPPAAPSGLTAVAVSTSQINLAWTDNSTDETNFQIERKLTVGGTFALVATVGAGIIVYSDGGLTPSTSYTYRVRAINAGGNSAYSNEAVAVTQATPPPPVPAAPSNLTATNPSQTALQILWQDNSTNETGFSLERAVGNGTFAVIQTTVANVTSYLDNVLTPDTLYRYRIRAFNAAGNSAYSNIATGTTLPVPPPVPSAPSALTAQQTGNRDVTLAWTDNANNEVGFSIERRLSGGTFGQIAQVPANTTSYIDTTVATATYDYRVNAFNTAGNSPFSNTATIAVVVPPVSPTVLTPSRFVYDGCLGLPLTGGVTTQNPFGSWGSLSGRVVNGQTRLFVLSALSDGSKLNEFTPPSVLASNPSQLGNNANFRGVMVRDWGNIYGEDPTTGNVKRENGPGNLTDVDGQIFFLNGKIYWTFWASYNVTGQNNRCIGLSELNDATGVSTRRGPWRCGPSPSNPNANAKFCGGVLALIPAAFATQFLNGRRIHMGNNTTSGSASSPLGLTWFSQADLVAPFPPEDSISNANAVTLFPIQHIAYQLNSRQPITIENWQRRICDYAEPGNHAVTTAAVAVGATSIPISDTTLFAVPGAGSQLDVIVGNFSGYIGASIQGVQFDYNGKSVPSGAGSLTGIPNIGVRSVQTAIPLGTNILLGKYDNGRGGVLSDPLPIFGPDSPTSDPGAVFWDYIGAPAWINLPDGTQGVVFCGSVGDSVVGDNYGTDDRNHVRYTGQATCPHGQVSPYFQATGPTATSTVTAGWIYDQADFARIAQGTLTQPNLVPAYYFRWNSLAPGISVEPRPQGGLRHAWFDDVNYRLYILERNTDLTFGTNSPLNLIHRFSFAGTPPAGRGPQPGVTQPVGSVAINAGSTTASRQTAINANPNGTTFWLRAGTHVATGSNTPKINNTFLGEFGAIIDGATWPRPEADLDAAPFKSIDNGITGVTIRNLKIINMPQNGVNAFLSASGWTVDHCEVAFNLRGVSLGFSGNYTNNFIHHNVGDDSSPNPALRGGGYGTSNGMNSQFVNNEVSFNGSEQKFLGSPVSAGNNHNIYIANNYVHDNHADGIWIDGDGQGTVIENNICEDNGRTGITAEIAVQITIRNNQVNRNVSGIYLTISRNCEVANNTLQNNISGLELFLDCSAVGSLPWNPDLANNNIHNNDVTVPAGSGNRAAIFTVASGSNSCQAPYVGDPRVKGNIFNFNTYRVVGSAIWTWGGVNKTWLQWQALPQDVNGTLIVT